MFPRRRGRWCIELLDTHFLERGEGILDLRCGSATILIFIATSERSGRKIHHKAPQSICTSHLQAVLEVVGIVIRREDREGGGGELSRGRGC